ncbi:hypothetical protein NGB36_21130 [Streptomyces sp. RB6PN25]|uniref:Uncharacterized protein n=1 Tax=Streptomyces humicola TaxID=2953240 RepID=A0ABT1PZD3_9ACTN|nr:hypothetical protein [Streptomyces humicola]MCQ4083039.1 hypothetical protein [Streptomyces humicola]
MDQETFPHQGADGDCAAHASPGTPGGLLEQLEALLAAVNADIAGLDARLQATAGRTLPEDDAAAH